MDNIFEILKNLTYEKKELYFDSEDIKSDYSQILVNRWISMCEAYLPIVNRINKCRNIPDEIHYKYYLNVLPQRKQYFEYLKKESKQDIQVKRMIARYFDCNIKEAEDYLRKLSDKEIQKIINTFKYGHNGNKTIQI